MSRLLARLDLDLNSTNRSALSGERSPKASSLASPKARDRADDEVGSLVCSRSYYPSVLSARSVGSSGSRRLACGCDVSSLGADRWSTAPLLRRECPARP
jgi:hypothetical protein